MTAGRNGIDYTTDSAANGPAEPRTDLATLVRLYIAALDAGNTTIADTLLQQMRDQHPPAGG